MTREEFNAYPMCEKLYARAIATGEKVRIRRESEDNVFVYAKGRSRYGYRMMTDAFLRSYEPLPLKNPEAEWQKRVDNVINRLEKFGLWEELLPDFQNLRKLTYADREAIKKIHNALPYDSARLEEEYHEIYKAYWDKYPFLFDAGGAKSWYLYGMSDCKVKTMYFGKGSNQIAKQNIARAMAGKVRCTEYGRTGYDVSFEYDPNRNKAWYSEEYRGCGNGHYYLALDYNAALFVEDD